MSDKLDRDTLFKKLRARPENKVRVLYNLQNDACQFATVCILQYFWPMDGSQLQLRVGIGPGRLRNLPSPAACLHAMYPL